MTTAEEHKSNGVGKDVGVYICILVLAGIQFLIAYQDISASQMFVRMLIVAIVEAALALLFFMHLWENRGLKWFVLIFTVAVILGMQYGWTDSFRLSRACRGQSSRGVHRPPERSIIEALETTRDPWHCAGGIVHPAAAHAGLLPKLRALLHSSGFFGLAHDSGLEERDSDPHHSSHAGIGWDDFCSFSKT